MTFPAGYVPFLAMSVVLSLPLILTPVQNPAQAATKTENVFLITLDGVRGQEVFGGANAGLILTEAGGVRDVVGMRDRFWRETAEERRQILMPFLWTVVAKEGQIFGDPSHNCHARLVNKKKNSRAGYPEMLCGFIDDTALLPPSNVLEWLNQRPRFAGRVSLYACWRPLYDLLHAERGKLNAFAGWQLLEDLPLTPREECINAMIPNMPRLWPEATYDFVIMQGALEHLRKRQPRIFHIALNDSDEFGHERRYDLYLRAIQNGDRFIRQFWKTLQSMPPYAGKTALIIATDHGRGNTGEDWTDHGEDTPGAENVWMAVLGPDTPSLGIRENQNVTLSQIAATLAGLVGEDARVEEARRSPPLPDVIQQLPSAPVKQ